MSDYIISENYTLPSGGKLYKEDVNPHIAIRSMTTADEMRRTAHSDLAYANLCKVIDDCLVEKPGISSYDMCIGDYVFLLHRLRIVTYGKEYKLSTICPICGKQHNTKFNLDELKVNEYTEELDKYLSIELPISKKKLALNVMTPRILDSISVEQEKLRDRLNDPDGEYTMQLTLSALIDKVDGATLNPIAKETFVKSLPMMDTNYILKCSEKINEKVGIDTSIHLKCTKCKAKYDSHFRINGEFFSPSIDI